MSINPAAPTTVPLYTNVRALPPTPVYPSIIVQGATATGSGPGEYIWNSTSTATDNGAIWIKKGTTTTGRYQRIVDNFYNVKWFGAKGDGSTDDYAAIQAGIDYLISIGSGRLYFPVGVYIVSQTPYIRNAKGIGLIGDGPDFTQIRAGAYPAMATEGFWRSFIEGIQFQCNANTTGGAFQLDGRIDGTFGSQGNTFTNCYFFGNYNSKYAFTISLISGGNGQGSENLFLNCGFAGVRGNAGDACLLNSGNNALNNTVIGGNFQSFTTGILVASGNINVYSAGFQSTYGYTQIANGGADIDNSSGNVGDTQIIQACRSESMILIKGGGGYMHVIGPAQQQSGASSWGASIAYPLNTLLNGVTAGFNRKAYLCTTAGTSGLIEPVWPESGTIADGTCVWTQLNYDVISGSPITVERGQIQLGVVGNGIYNDVLFTRDDPQNHPNIVGVYNRCFTGGNPPPGGSARQIFGTSQTGSVTVADLPATPRPGVMIYVNDATPGTYPATGAGDGALCIADETNTWRALT